MVQLKCNLIPTCVLPGEKVWMNLQMGAGKGRQRFWSQFLHVFADCKGTLKHAEHKR